jgi:type III secretory pathway component EscS
MFWSVNFALTAFRTFECLSMALLIIATIQYLFENEDTEGVIRWSLYYCTITIFFEIIGILKWARTFGEFQEASQMTSTTFFYMALYFAPRKWYNYLIIFMSVISLSTVAYIGMAIGLVSSFWNKRYQCLSFIMALSLIIVCLSIGPEKVLKDTLFFDKQEVSLKQTSGRDKLMDITIKTVEKNPIGLGFFAAEPYIFYRHHYHAISAHNSLFSAALGLGIPGLIIIVIFFFRTGIILLSNSMDEKYRSMLIGCFCVAFLHCMGNPSVGTRVYPFGAWMTGMYIFVLICAMYADKKYYKLF